MRSKRRGCVNDDVRREKGNSAMLCKRDDGEYKGATLWF